MRIRGFSQLACVTLFVPASCTVRRALHITLFVPVPSTAQGVLRSLSLFIIQPTLAYGHLDLTTERRLYVRLLGMAGKVRVCIQIYTPTYTHIYVQTYTHTYIHTNLHTSHLHTHLHTHLRRLTPIQTDAHLHRQTHTTLYVTLQLPRFVWRSPSVTSLLTWRNSLTTRRIFATAALRHFIYTYILCTTFVIGI